MKKLLLVFTAVLALGGCANLQNAWDKLSSAQVTMSTVTVAGNSFDGLEAAATRYLQLPRCTGANGPICRDPVITKKVISAVRSGRVARANLEQFFVDHPGQLGPQGLYDALQAAIDTLNGIITANSH